MAVAAKRAQSVTENPTPIEQLERLLNQERQAIGASSCTFYVRDPYWTDQFRLVCMPGVRFREPMHGWVFNDRTKIVLADGDPEYFSEHPQPYAESEEENAVIKKSPYGFLFQDFVGRESVKSVARLLHFGSEGNVESVLFVNFSKKMRFNEPLKKKIRAILKKASSSLLAITEELRGLDAPHLAETVKILHPAPALARSESPELETQFKNLLQLSMNALKISQSEGVGTIHLHDPQKGLLKLVASFGNAPKVENARIQDASSGQGIVAWVALKRKALLIDDLTKSKFGKIRVVINDKLKSELAVPMIANGELVGVLNLECTRERAFQPATVRSIWYAANSAATAFQLTKRSRTTRRLLSICEVATRDETGARQALADIAGILAETLSADSCDIWHFNTFFRRFDAAAATYQPFVPALRKDGWTHYVWRTQQAVWLSELRSEAEFAVSYWDAEWQKIPSKPELVPHEINKKVLENQVVAELGLPIKVAQDCVGVAWIKFLGRVRQPAKDRMPDAFSVASQAGLVLELVQRLVERPDRSHLATIADRLKPFSTSGPLEFGSLPLEGYIVHRPFHAFACGDFHAVSTVDNSVAGLLLGDGEGKAVTGLLNALPLITGFTVFGSGSGSTRHVIDRLRMISRRLGLSGTAFYWTFTMIGKTVWLAMTCAGHPLPILVRQGSTVGAVTIPGPDSPALGKPLGIDLDSPQGEHFEPLQPGDLLIAYTDGLTDGLANPEADDNADPGEPVGRIMSMGLEEGHRSCKELAELIMATAETANPLLDDATVCVVRHKQMKGAR